ncbi:Rieske 2Fe-2S domain-containing protein [Methylobacterium indicum]|uniref:Rieske domain-containing protein n=1 Tax=Methylobacterium indicum TaxID=1775910 RepID=A0A8H8WZT0_9HYPH|nr:Rieske 2Fe-2S domain-containing protein [Methylobacterium indicum]BCM87685.1 hypothetical protein mvi_61460 [Methylobacterium indicum]
MAVKKVSIAADCRVLVELPQQGMRVLVVVDSAEVRVVNDKCRHRGGPIHLCYRDSGNVRRCPWHDRKIGRDYPSGEVCATYQRSRGLLQLVSHQPQGAPWPVRVIAPEAQAAPAYASL